MVYYKRIYFLFTYNAMPIEHLHRSLTMLLEHVAYKKEKDGGEALVLNYVDLQSRTCTGPNLIEGRPEMSGTHVNKH